MYSRIQQPLLYFKVLLYLLCWNGHLLKFKRNCFLVISKIEVQNCNWNLNISTDDYVRVGYNRTHSTLYKNRYPQYTMYFRKQQHKNTPE